MPAATTRDELIRVTIVEYARLETLLAKIDEKTAGTPIEGISIKDIVAHRAHWIGLFLGWYADGVAGRPVFFPAKGYKWNDLNRYNAELRAARAALTWPEACNALQNAHDTLLDFLQGKSQSELYDGPMPGAKNAWPTGRWAESAGPSHYRSAVKTIRAMQRALEPD